MVPGGKVYRGRWVRWGPMVEVDGKPLPPRYDLKQYPRLLGKQATGSMFCWGDASPESAQLSLALLADCLNDDAKALSLYMTFCTRFITHLPTSGWRLREKRLREMIAEFE